VTGAGDSVAAGCVVHRAGQAIFLFALLMLLTGVGVAIDSSSACYWSGRAERAASAAALSGVVFVPNQLTPAQAIPTGSANVDDGFVVAIGIKGSPPHLVQS
jgi:hypothetical protein